jgi:hypothetical protein
MGCAASHQTSCPLDDLTVSRFASGGRCVEGGAHASLDIYKPIFSQRPEHAAHHRFREVIRMMQLLHPLCFMSQNAFDQRERLIVRWTTPRPLPSNAIPDSCVSPGSDIFQPSPEPEGSPLASVYVYRTQRRLHSFSVFFRKRISLADVDRGLREPPFFAAQCSTNLSNICIRAFNTVKFFLGKHNKEREDERLDVVEFHMLLCFVVTYLEALVLLDHDSPIYEVNYDREDCNRVDDAARDEGYDVLPLGSCAHFPAGETALTAESVAKALLQPSTSMVSIGLGGGGGGGTSGRSTGAVCRVHLRFYQSMFLPRIIASGTAFQRLRREFPSMLFWSSVNDVPEQFRRDMTVSAATVLFPDLARVQALTIPLNCSLRRGSGSAGVTVISGESFRQHSASFGSSPHAHTAAFLSEDANACDEPFAASCELSDFFARAKVMSVFEDVLSETCGAAAQEARFSSRST